MRRAAALLGILGLVLQAYLPLIDAPGAAAAQKRAGIFWLAGALCKSAPAPAKGAGSGTPAHQALCPICLALAGGGAFLLPTAAMLVSALAVSFALRSRPAPLRGGRPWSLAAFPRAPPLPA